MGMVISGHACLPAATAGAPGRFGSAPPRAWDQRPTVGLTGKGSDVLEGLSASLSGNLLNQDGTEIDFEDYDDVLAALGALPDKLSVESVEADEGTFTNAAFGDFDGAQVVVDTHDLAYAASVACLRATRDTLRELKVQLTQARTLVEDTEVLVATSLRQVVTVNNFSLNSSPSTGSAGEGGH